MATVFHPVSPAVAGQIMKVKELVAVKEVEKPLTKQEVHQERVPDQGYYVESLAQGRLSSAEQGGQKVTQLSKDDLLSLNADRSRVKT